METITVKKKDIEKILNEIFYEDDAKEIFEALHEIVEIEIDEYSLKIDEDKYEYI